VEPGYMLSMIIMCLKLKKDRVPIVRKRRKN